MAHLRHLLALHKRLALLLPLGMQLMRRCQRLLYLH
jgi:hypothetical protein